MTIEDYCSGCARTFPADQLTERGSQLLCPDCAAGRTGEDPEVRAMRQRLGRRLTPPPALDLVVVGTMVLLLGVGWGLLLAPASPWWSLALAAMPAAIGAYLKLRADPDNLGTSLTAVGAGALVPAVGFATHLAAHAEALWIGVVLIPFGAATAIFALLGKR